MSKTSTVLMLAGVAVFTTLAGLAIMGAVHGPSKKFAVHELVGELKKKRARKIEALGRLATLKIYPRLYRDRFMLEKYETGQSLQEEWIFDLTSDPPIWSKKWKEVMVLSFDREDRLAKVEVTEVPPPMF